MWGHVIGCGVAQTVLHVVVVSWIWASNMAAPAFVTGTKQLPEQPLFQLVYVQSASSWQGPPSWSRNAPTSAVNWARASSQTLGSTTQVEQHWPGTSSG